MIKSEDYFKDLIINCLNIGKDNARKQDYIKDRTGLNKRDIRRIIQSLRKDGYPICSSTYDGYWIADSKEDIDECLMQLTAQIKTLNETASALIETKAKLFGE